MKLIIVIVEKAIYNFHLLPMIYYVLPYMSNIRFWISKY